MEKTIRYHSISLSPDREIEDFELNPSYYNNLLNVGEEDKCINELAELMFFDIPLFVSVFSGCNDGVRLSFSSSQALKDVNIAIRLSVLGLL